MNHPAPYSPYAPHAPYAPYGAPVPAPRGTNALAIVSLVWTLVLFMLPIVPLITAPISLRQIRRRGEGGKACAVIALVLAVIASIIWVVFWIALIANDGQFHYSYSTG